MLFKIGNQSLEKEAFDRAMKARKEKEERENPKAPEDISSTKTIEELRAEYLEKHGKKVANVKKNNREWIISKL